MSWLRFILSEQVIFTFGCFFFVICKQSVFLKIKATSFLLFCFSSSSSSPRAPLRERIRPSSRLKCRSLLPSSFCLRRSKTYPLLFICLHLYSRPTPSPSLRQHSGTESHSHQQTIVGVLAAVMAAPPEGSGVDGGGPKISSGFPSCTFTCPPKGALTPDAHGHISVTTAEPVELPTEHVASGSTLPVSKVRAFTVI